MTKFYIYLHAALMILAVCAITVIPTRHTAGPLTAGGNKLPSPNPYWSVAAWFIDPANASGTASDSNDCQTSATACLTWRQINDGRWGCVGSPQGCPQLRQNTTITWESSQSGNTDPVYFFPVLENGANVVIKASTSGTSIATGTISNFTALSRSAATFTQMTLPTPAGGLVDSTNGYPGNGSVIAPPQLVVDSTTSAKWWVYKLDTGSIYYMSNPLKPYTAPNAVGTYYSAPSPAVANGDSVTLFNQTAVDIVAVVPILADWDAAQNASVWIQGIRILSPAQAFAFNNASNGVLIGSYVSLLDVSSDRSLVKILSSNNAVDLIQNVFAFNLVGAPATSGNSEFNENVLYVIGGVLFEGTTWGGHGSLILDGDLIMRDSSLISAQISCVGIDSAGQWQIGGSTNFYASGKLGCSTGGAGHGRIYALTGTTGSVDILAGGRVTSLNANYPVNTNISSCGGTSFCNGSGSTLPVACGIGMTSTNLALPVADGGCGGNCWQPGCGSIGTNGSLFP